MSTKLMQGTYYEIANGMEKDIIVNVNYTSLDDDLAKREAAETERTAYRNDYDKGKRIDSVKLYDPYGDGYYPVGGEELYYEPLPREESFAYQMLGRLKSDCDYFLGNGFGYEPHLWAGTVEKQIKEMRDRWNAFADEDKPEWLTMEQINEYERNMLQARESRKKAEANIEPGTSYSFRWEVTDD